MCADHSRLVGDHRFCKPHAVIVAERIAAENRKEAERRYTEEDAQYKQEKVAQRRRYCESVDVFASMMMAAGSPGLRTTYDARQIELYVKTKRIKGWEIGTRAFVRPDGSILRPEYKQFGKRPAGELSRPLVKHYREELIVGEERGPLVEQLFYHFYYATARRHNPVETMGDILSGHGLSWPESFSPPGFPPAPPAAPR